MDSFLNAVSFFSMLGFVELATYFIDGVLHGYHFPKWFPIKTKNTKPILTSFKIPLIVIKIIVGFIYQIAFPFLYMNYSKLWTSKARTIILSIILVRAGLELDFKGKTLISLACGMIPVMSEVFMVSLIGHFGMGLTYPFALAQGYVVGAGSPGIIIPILLNFKMRGVGLDSGIVPMLISTITIDEICSIIGFGAAETFAFNEVINDPEESNEIVVHLIVEILAAIGVGAVAGLFMYPLRHVRNKIKVVPLITFAVGIVFAFEAANFYESKYLASLIFGYVSNKIWHENAPEHELNQLWKLCSPALFGSIGADIDLSKINAGVLGWTFLIIACGMTTKFTVMWGLANIFFKKTWTKGEKLFSSGCCLGKAAFQASLGSSVLNMAIKFNATAYYPMSYDILTISIICILIAGPVGSITTISLGNKYLTKKTEKPNLHFAKEEHDIYLDDDKSNPQIVTSRMNFVIENIQESVHEQTENYIPDAKDNLSSNSSSEGIGESEIVIEMEKMSSIQRNKIHPKEKLSKKVNFNNENESFPVSELDHRLGDFIIFHRNGIQMGINGVFIENLAPLQDIGNSEVSIHCSTERTNEDNQVRLNAIYNDGYVFPLQDVGNSEVYLETYKESFFDENKGIEKKKEQ